MKAMILAAGRGERLRPLTDETPKPLIRVGDECLIERHLRRLSSAGFTEIVINVSHLGHLIEQTLGDGRQYGTAITYSHEPDGPLETAGGIHRALGLLGTEPFVVVNGDIWTDFDFSMAKTMKPAAIVLVSNPPHHPKGDFDFERQMATHHSSAHAYTYAGIGIFQPSLFADLGPEPVPLGPILFELAAAGELNATIHPGAWFDIGTLERLKTAREFASQASSLD